ncbi:GNAT family N-acetyltransferase [Pseudooceanicola nanhaiensis]|uniref:GNAT family N-acetyltransferase n=1 Tax=Pseudooceanicola nanhaiensis TaxID=375761 RepID=UPI001CD7305B|nr:GNAT family N-acetyltransferase [Pseudooceanicola nanhaiensis]MCA0920975.1 GNAT family N-acetyltransferase [Pseudooceanicola nanhaiensis]
MALPEGYRLVERTPTAEEHTALRAAAGLSPHGAEATRAGLPGTIYAVVIETAGRAIGMGRLIGDGGLAFQVVDIAVDPAHQGRGLGHAIVAALSARIAQLPPTAYVSLIADGPAKHLYARFGFVETAPASVGMALKLPVGAS